MTQTSSTPAPAAPVATPIISMFQRIVESRLVVTADLLNTTIKVRLSSQPIQEIPVQDKDGNVVFSKSSGFQLFKKILNTKAASQMAIDHGYSKKYNCSTPELLDICIAQLENGASPEKMSDEMNEYVKRTSFKFSLLSTDRAYNTVASGLEISGAVSQITTEKGNVWSLAPNTIQIVAPVALAKGTSVFARRAAAMAVPHVEQPVTADVNAEIGAPAPAADEAAI